MSNRALRQSLAVTAVLALLLGAGAPALYAFIAEKGSVSGMVLSADGKPMQGLQLRMEQEVPLGMDKGGRRSAVQANGSDPVGLMQGTKVIARATTDKDGKFSFTNLNPGAYILVGGSKNIGWIYYPLVVEAGKDTALGEIKLHKE